MGFDRSWRSFDAYAIRPGAIVGVGIVVVMGLASHEAGPSILVAILISAEVASFTAMSSLSWPEESPKRARV